MIFILHYILLNVGLPAIIILITLFLHTHSQASLTEIGALLMALPFVSIVTKPLFCALADRHQAHKQYLMASLAFMALGYGSLVIAPFFPEFVREHGRLVWYLDILGIIVGFGAFGIVWSLGDALAVNGAQMAGVSWGSYRLWAVISWGVFGALIGLINELPFLPAYVPGMLMLVISLLIEIVLLAVWPNDRFVMCAHLDNQIIKPEHQGHHYNNTTSQPSKTDEHQMAEFGEYYWPASKSHDGTLTMSMAGTLSAPPKVLGAVANIFMEDVGDTLKSTLKMGSRGAPRKGLSEILGEEGLTGFGAGTATGLGGATRPELDRAKSNESAQSVRSGNKLAAGVAAAATVPSLIHVTTTITDLPPIVDDIKQEQQQQQVEQEKADIKSGTGNNTGSRAVALSTSLSNSSTAVEPPAPRSAEDIQLFLLKLIVRRDKTIGKYLVLFTLFGLLMMCHISYFYMNVRQLCSLRNESFALISGAMMLAHAVSEVTSFLLVPRYIPWAGRVGALMTCAALYLVRFLYYGLWLNQLPTYYGIPFEFCHGLSYGIIYSLICDIAVECVDQVDEFLPELIAGGLVRADIRPSELKSPLRATMQGVFSGAFDGLGNGLGALCGGIFLDSYPFERLWQVCAGVCLVILVIYPLTEWQTLVGGGGGRCRRRRSTVK